MRANLGWVPYLARGARSSRKFLQAGALRALAMDSRHAPSSGVLWAVR